LYKASCTVSCDERVQIFTSISLRPILSFTELPYYCLSLLFYFILLFIFLAMEEKLGSQMVCSGVSMITLVFLLFNISLGSRKKKIFRELCLAFNFSNKHFLINLICNFVVYCGQVGKYIMWFCKCYWCAKMFFEKNLLGL
jgi:hypothetical protein